MKLFPAFLDLERRLCLVVGGGRIGLDKARSLAAAGANVLVLDPSPSEELAREAAGGALCLEARAFRSDDCRGRILVFACTGDDAVDTAVAEAANVAGVLCSRADGAPSDFTSAATLRHGDVCVAVSSGGASPGLAAEARDRIATIIGPEYGEAASLLGALREKLRGAVRDEAARRAALGGSLVTDVLAALREGARTRAEAFVEEAFASACRGTRRSES